MILKVILFSMILKIIFIFYDFENNFISMILKIILKIILFAYSTDN